MADRRWTRRGGRWLVVALSLWWAVSAVATQDDVSLPLMTPETLLALWPDDDTTSVRILDEARGEITSASWTAA